MIRRWWRRRLERKRASLVDWKLKLRFTLLGLELQRARAAGTPREVVVAAAIDEGREQVADLDRRIARLERRIA